MIEGLFLSKGDKAPCMQDRVCETRAAMTKTRCGRAGFPLKDENGKGYLFQGLLPEYRDTGAVVLSL